MTLEVLFAQAAQGRTFLLMTLGGAALALGVQLAGFLHQRSRWLGMGADLLLAAGMTLTVAHILLRSGAGLRLYAVLGLCIGAAVYMGGLAPAVGWVGRLSTKNAGKHTGGTK